MKEEKRALPPCPGLLRIKSYPAQASVADLGFILLNINQVKFKIPYTALSAKSASCRP